MTNTKKKIMSVEWRVVQLLNNYFSKRSKPLTEGTYDQFKRIAKAEHDKEVCST